MEANNEQEIMAELECGCDILIADFTPGIFECSCGCIHRLNGVTEDGELDIDWI